mmetsp:Transcript_11564/g.13435  ORF Transcript_11564/g.13435 Transcript_11564/m.13435 type:complete len:107 (+) Transcript_11564:1-321(+)
MGSICRVYYVVDPMNHANETLNRYTTQDAGGEARINGKSIVKSNNDIFLFVSYAPHTVPHSQHLKSTIPGTCTIFTPWIRCKDDNTELEAHLGKGLSCILSNNNAF